MTRRRVGYAALAAFLLVMAAAACSSTAPAKPRHTPPPRPPADGGWYSSSSDLLAAMAKGGVDCRDYEQIANPTNGAVELGTCYVNGDRSRDVPVGIYASAADAANGIRPAASFGGTFLIGQNWTLNLDDKALASKLREAIGGHVLTTTLKLK